MISITIEKMIVSQASEGAYGKRAADMTFPTVDATVRVTTGNIQRELIVSNRYSIRVIIRCVTQKVTAYAMIQCNHQNPHTMLRKRSLPQPQAL